MFALVLAAAAFAQHADATWARRPDATIDLASPEGVDLVQGTWRYRDARIVEVAHRAPGPDLRASGAPTRSHDIEPKAGAIDFDDAGWEQLDPTTLDARRGLGRLAFSWYRIRITIPERVAGFDPTGSTVVFEIVADDYAEVWVDGALPVVLGQSGGALVAGWNAPNRLVVARDARPGQRIQLAVFAGNGPMSEPPANFVWIRSAALDFYGAERGAVGQPVEVSVAVSDPRFHDVLPAPPRVERIAGGFTFAEGPVWSPRGDLLFSDPNDNRIYRWTEAGELSVFRTRSGYGGFDIGAYHQPGSNGLAFDAEGRLTICEHGNRRVTRLELNGVVTVLADRFDGKRLNSPNDLVYRSDGTLYFTDPPFGLPGLHGDPRRELDVCGVFCLRDGRLTLVSRDLSGPNGVAFSPDERFLYVTNWDRDAKVVMRYVARPDGSLVEGVVFHDMGGAPGAEALDGIEVDRAGNLFVSGPGGIWVLSAAGAHLGTIALPELASNFAWGGDDRRTLFVTARTGVYRLRLGADAPRARTTPAAR